MLTRIGLMLGSLLLVLCVAQSCKKDELNVQEENIFENPFVDVFYDSFGTKLEEAVSTAIIDPTFKESVIQHTQKMLLGDYEVLLTTLLQEDEKAILLQEAEGLFTEEELDTYLENHPSMILGVRGPFESWEADQHTPTVVFVPSDFKEEARSIEGTQNGTPTEVNLVDQFEDAVIALRLSERRYKDGSPNDYFRNAGGTKGSEKSLPGVNLSEPGTANSVMMCVEPTDCLPTTPQILYFNATPQNGAIYIEYVFDNMPTNYCNWFRIKIHRLNPDGSTTTFLRGADDPISFYDNSVYPNQTFFYQVEAYLAFIDNNIGDWTTCNEVSSNVVMATAPEFSPPLETFRGANMNNSALRYYWEVPPSGAYEFRLSKWSDVNNNYNPVATLNGSTTEYIYNHPSGDRGDAVKMQIQYRSGGGSWQGDFYDRTYASFRNPDEPLYFYGIHLPYFWWYEQGQERKGSENQINGYPEIRLVWYQGDASENTSVSDALIPMTKCASSIEPGYYGVYNFFYPTLGSHLITNWDNALYGTAITIRLYETDENEPQTGGSTTTQTQSVSLTADVGYKDKDTTSANGSLGVGVSSSWKSGNSTSYSYPVTDIPLGIDIIYYHQERLQVRDNRVYGTQNYSSQPCYPFTFLY